MAQAIINCYDPCNDYAVASALAQARNDAMFDPMTTILIDRLIQAWALRMNPPAYQSAGQIVYG